MSTKNQGPLWIKKVGKQTGRDHLGIESVGESMLEDISNGISNITQRARYFSFYCWVLKEFFESELPKTKSSYKLFLNKAALLYTLSMSISHLDESGTGIDGIDFARSTLDDILTGKKILDETFLKSKEYKNNNWIYKAKLNDLGLTAEDTKTGIPYLVTPKGKGLAEAFDENVSELKIEKVNFRSLNEKLLRDLEKKWCFHRLKDNEKERKLLEEVLFSKNVEDRLSEVEAEKDLNRRYTLVLFLKFIFELNSEQRNDFEKWVYFEKTELPTKLSHIRSLWKLLFARNYLVFCIESIFFYFLESLKTAPLSLHDFINALKRVDLNGSLKDILGLKHNFNKTLDYSLGRFIKEAFNSKHANEEMFLNDPNPISEPNLVIPLDNIKRRFKKEDLDKFIIFTTICLFSLYSRWKDHKLLKEYPSFAKRGLQFRLSLNYFIRYIDVGIQRNITLKELLTGIIKNLIIARHILISSQKLYSRNLDTFHFKYENDRFYYVEREQGFEPKYNFLKIDQIYNFLEDLDLIEISGEDKYKLTHRGEALLDEYYE